VDYKGCIERQDLLNKASRLWQEYSQSRKGNINLIFSVYSNICDICIQINFNVYKLNYYRYGKTQSE